MSRPIVVRVVCVICCVRRVRRVLRVFFCDSGCCFLVCGFFVVLEGVCMGSCREGCRESCRKVVGKTLSNRFGALQSLMHFPH